MKRKPLENPVLIGCGTCGSAPLQILDNSKTFFPGGVHFLVLRIDKKHHQINSEDGIKLHELEVIYKDELDKCSFAELEHITPLHEETWELNTKDKKWYLVNQGLGYA